MAVCRICRSTVETDPKKGPMIRYSKRHSVHAQCGITRWGERFLDKLTFNTAKDLPYLMLKKAGLIEAVQRRFLL